MPVFFEHEFNESNDVTLVVDEQDPRHDADSIKYTVTIKLTVRPLTPSHWKDFEGLPGARKFGRSCVASFARPRASRSDGLGLKPDSLQGGTHGTMSL